VLEFAHGGRLTPRHAFVYNLGGGRERRDLSNTKDIYSRECRVSPVGPVHLSNQLSNLTVVNVVRLRGCVSKDPESTTKEVWWERGVVSTRAVGADKRDSARGEPASAPPAAVPARNEAEPAASAGGRARRGGVSESGSRKWSPRGL